MLKDKQFKDRLRIRDSREYNLEVAGSGTTCTIVVVQDGSVYYGFIGDSLACMSKVLTQTSQFNTKNNDLILTKPIHLPSHPHEKMRIYRSRGEVRGETLDDVAKKKVEAKEGPLDSEEEHALKLQQERENDFKINMLNNARARVYVRGRNYPGLGVTRSFGDYTAHRIGVTAEPTIGSKAYTRNNEFLILATRAVWNVMTPKEVFHYIKKSANYGLGYTSRSLAHKVRDLYLQKNDSIPDITIIIQYLQM